MRILDMNNCNMEEYYDRTLKEIAKQNKNISVKEWLKVSKGKDILSVTTMKGYASRSMTWGKIKQEAHNKYGSK